MPEATYANTTILNPLAVAITLAAIVAMWKLPKGVCTVPFLLCVYFVTERQRISVLQFDFTMLRFMLLVAFLRMHVRGELKVFRLNRIDKVFLAYALISATLYVLLQLSPASIANRLGFLINTLGLYFFFRVQVQTLPETMLAIRTIAAVSVAISFFVLVELKTGQNLFSVFGGVPEPTEMRQGNLRCNRARRGVECAAPDGAGHVATHRVAPARHGRNA
jgi:hypothetical protein